MPALIAASLIGAGSSLVGAKIQSNAAKTAAKTQQAGTDRALQIQQQANKPYMDLGSAAAGRLGALVGNATPYTQQFTGAGGSNGYQAFNPNLGPAPAGPPPGSLGSFGGRPNAFAGGGPGGPMAQRSQMPPGGPQGPPQMPPGAPMAGGGPMGQASMPAQQSGPVVMLQAPTGEQISVPMAAAQQAMQKDPNLRIVG